MKKLFYPLTLALTLLATSCTNNQEDITNTTDPSGKTPISFVGEATTAPAKTRAGFEANTQIAMHIRSTKDKDNKKETRVLLTASEDETRNETSFSAIEAANSDYIRYWDDAYGRDAKLSVFAIAVPGKIDATNGKDSESKDIALVDHLAASSGWSIGVLSESVTWTLSSDQSGTNVLSNEDLVYSNNIQAGGQGGVKSYNYTDNDYTTTANGELQFRLQTTGDIDGPGKFDRGHLKFIHALSRITINLIKGAGYDDDEFKFADDTKNITINGVPTSGSLNIETGEWTSSAYGISKMATITTAAGAKYSLMAQMLPGYEINKEANDNVLEFTIANNKYYVTESMMFTALSGKTGITKETTGAITMEQGRNYEFNLTVAKSGITDMQAALEPWVDVTATTLPVDNAHISVSLFSNSSSSAFNFSQYDLYRLNDLSDNISTAASTSKNWAGDYTDKADWTENGKTKWYFENNKSFYHFRAVNNGTKIVSKEKGTDNTETDVVDYFSISSGAQSNHDYHWGAPLLSTTTTPLKYDTSKGYEEYISPAIGATNSAINITDLHMMSNINVFLRTPNADNKVKLEDGSGTDLKQCEVSLTNFYADGKVNMGNGLVSTTGDITTNSAFTKPTAGITEEKNGSTTEGYKTNAFTFAIVPQALKRTTGTNPYIGITIKTPDGNVYNIMEKLSEITASVNGNSKNQTTSSNIQFWYPGHNYTYTFTLTKTGITNVTASVQDWVNVTAGQTVTLE